MAVTRFRRAIGYVSLLAVALTISTAAAPIARAQDYAAILAASDRTAADRENDKRREAPKLLAFIGPKTGWQVLDMGAGAGYSTELMARAVAPNGRVWGQSDKPSERFETRLKTPAMSNAVVNQAANNSDVLSGKRATNRSSNSDGVMFDRNPCQRASLIATVAPFCLTFSPARSAMMR